MATINRNYQLPVPAHDVADDVLLLIQAFEAVDGDVQALLNALSGKAAAAHAHAIGDVEGLQTALNGKADANHAHALDDLSDVSGAAAAPDGYLLVKGPTGWLPASPAASIGNHDHSIAQVLGLSDALGALIATSTIGTVAHYLQNTAGKVLTTDAVYGASVEVLLTYQATMALNFGTFRNALIQMTGSLSLGAFSGAQPGQSGCIRLQMMAAGLTLALHTSFVVTGGGDPACSTTSGAIDYLYYHVVNASLIHINFHKGVA